jgi:hypothetical protein
MGFTNKTASDILAGPVKPEVITKSEGKTDVLNLEPDKGDRPFIGYEGMYKRPYTADFFNLSYYTELNDKNDVNKIRSKVKGIEDFIKQEIQDKGLEDSTSTYRDFIKRIMGYIGESKKDEKLLDRVASFLDLIKQIRDHDKKIAKKMESLGVKQ